MMVSASTIHFLLGIFFSPCLSKCVLAELYTFRYPTSGKVSQSRPKFISRVESHPLQENHPPCAFNSQCSCSSNSHYDLGIVFCENVELGRVPPVLNSSRVHTLTLRSNKLRQLDERSFYGSSGLWRLEIRHNDLFRIPEKAFLGIGRSLSELDLRYNELSKMPREAMQGLRKLKLLDLTGNHITSVAAEDFEGFNRYLVRLLMASNSLVEIPDEAFGPLSSLTELDLQDNNIRSIRNRAFEGASPTLRHLNLANNLLSSIPFMAFSYLKGLQYLNLERNLISQPYDVMFMGSLSLDTLILDFNAIEYLPPHSFQNFDSVNTSSFRGNPLQKIGADAFKGSKIRELYLQDCDIWNLSEKSFRGIEATLETLDLSYNNLTDIPENIFDRIDSLKWLSLAHNKLILDPKKSFNGFTYTLQYLNMLGEYMGIIPMDALKNMRNVRTFAFSTFPGFYLSNEDFVGFGPAVEKLYLMNNEISSVKALAFEHVPGLKVLDLSHNVINSFDNRAFANVGGLEELRVSSGLTLTRLPPQPFHYLINLRILDLSNNKLTFLQNDCLSHMKKLRHLNLEDNKISKLSSHQFRGQFTPELTTIQLSFNAIPVIESMTFHDLDHLKYIYLDDNMITSVKRFAFANLADLEYLSLVGNNIRDLEFEAFQNIPKVRHLDLSYNEMINLNLDAFEQVGTLSSLKIDVSHNKISALKMNGTRWSSISSIKTIDFSYNNISSIDTEYFESVRISLQHLRFSHNNMYNLSANIFSKMLQIQLLDFSNNHISVVDPEAFRETDLLRSIDLSYNNIKDLPLTLFKNHRYLSYVDLSGNLMHRMPDDLFRLCPVEILKLSKNNFHGVPDNTLHHITETLRVLDLSWNSLTNISDAVIGGLENLIALDISHNKIHLIGYRSFHDLWRLTSLDVSNNPLNDIDLYTFDGLQDSLQNLSVANTSIKSFPELQHPKLAVLNASNNILSFLPTNTMANLTGIRTLDVSHNELTAPGSNAWQVMPYLRDLRLQGNFVRSITNSTFASLSRLQVLDIRDFPLHVFQADNSLGSELRGGALPYRLTNVTLIGHKMKQIDPKALDMLTSRQLRLTFLRTGLTYVPHELFTNLGRVRFVAVAAHNNSLTGLGEPYTTVNYPGVRGSVFLTDLSMSQNKWTCDCGIGWLETWLKVWRSSVCVSEGALQPYLECQQTVRQLRRTPCADRHKSLMEALKQDLECGVSGATLNSLGVRVSTLACVWTWLLLWKLEVVLVVRGRW
ncbi:chaoptin [Hyalella azteca]|uniref:Chaoptin n=1 Tax=Hyalella azteca TaxID=294128 RepID=A0A8B7PG66_HYAAZ|nr:chaoptin [Hyalella azteca]